MVKCEECTRYLPMNDFVGFCRFPGEWQPRLMDADERCEFFVGPVTKEQRHEALRTKDKGKACWRCLHFRDLNGDIGICRNEKQARQLHVVGNDETCPEWE